MSQGVNQCNFIGNLGKDPEVRYTQTGNAVCNLRVAITERVKDGDDWRDKTEWIDIVTFGKEAENCGQFLAKGRQIYAETRVQTRKWQDKEGKDRYSTEFVARRVNFLGKGEGEKPAAAQSSSSSSAPSTPNGSDAAPADADDTPF